MEMDSYTVLCRGIALRNGHEHLHRHVRTHGLSNAEIAFYTSALYLPWVVKPLWSPFIDLAKSKRWWILAMEFLIAAAIAGVAFTLPSAHFLVFTLMFLC